MKKRRKKKKQIKNKRNLKREKKVLTYIERGRKIVI
jgi:hypothetical protein